jgi:hypothetical protein
VHRPAGDASAIAARALQRLGSFNLGLSAIASAFTWALVNWVADVLCLAAAIAAIGVAVPWGRLLLIWSAGAAAASFSPTPYGLGVVDIALITALTGAGLKMPDAVGAVLLYRIVSFKILVTLLWIGYRYLKERTAPAEPVRQAAAHEPGSPAALAAALGAGTGIVPVDDDHGGDMVGEHPRGQQAGDAAAEHDSGVQHDRSDGRRVRIDRPVSAETAERQHNQP